MSKSVLWVGLTFSFFWIYWCHSAHEVVIQTLLLESRGEGLDGITAVGEVIRTRSRTRKQSFSEICLASHQFSCWNSPKAAKRAISGVSGREHQLAVKAWELSQHTKLVNNADHYCTFTVTPYWCKNKIPTAVIGLHRFFNLETK